MTDVTSITSMELEELESLRAVPSQRSEMSDRRRRRHTILMLLGCGILQLPIWAVPMTFGIWQDFLEQHQVVKGPRSATGVIGTTMNGVLYLSMPVLSMMMAKPRWIPRRRTVAIVGCCLSSLSFLISSWSTEVWHLILLQGVLAALGSAMLYVPTTLWLDEWFRGGNRATAYGVQFSIKNIVGTTGPFLMYALLRSMGIRNTIQVWAGISLMTGLGALAIVPQPRPIIPRAEQAVSWNFLRHPTFYVYAMSNIMFSSGYGLPQTYLSQYASQMLHLPSAESSAMIAIFNVSGIISCTGFGLLSDKAHISATNNTLISALGSALCVFLLWGLKSHMIPGLLIAFSIGYGFFASGYSSTWGGWIKDLEQEAANHHESINTGMLYGFMNGARGVGYVVGGLSGVELLKLGAVEHSQKWAYGTTYGAVIIFTGITSLLGGWSVAWRCKLPKARSD